MNPLIRTYLSTKWPAIIWSAIVFILLAMPGTGLFNETWFSKVHMDKLVHAFLFYVLTWLWVNYAQRVKTISTTVLMLFGAMATLYGVVMEYVQLYVGRDFSVGDMVADGAGAFFGILVSRKK
jgi:VanZ like family